MIWTEILYPLENNNPSSLIDTRLRFRGVIKYFQSFKKIINEKVKLMVHFQDIVERSFSRAKVDRKLLLAIIPRLHADNLKGLKYQIIGH